MADASPIKRLSAARIECLVEIPQDRFASAEEQALRELGRNAEVDGFRAGKVPIEVLREKLDPADVLAQTVHALLPGTVAALVGEHGIRPIIPPKVEILSPKPPKLKITFVERPEVKLKGIAKIKIAKKEPAVDAENVRKMVDYVLEQHQTCVAVDREARTGDRVTMDFSGRDAEKKKIDGIRTTGHRVVIGSHVLIPGFEDALAGMKAGSAKEFTLTFPAKYHAERLQGKPVTFAVTVRSVEEVSTPRLTDAFALSVLHAPSADAFREQVRASMLEQETRIESERRRHELLDAIRQATAADLAPELVSDEFRSLTEDLREQLSRQNITVEQWIAKTGKKPEEVHRDMRAQAEKRLLLRFGLGKLVEEKEIAVSDVEKQKAIDEALAEVPEKERPKLAPTFEKGGSNYERLLWQTKGEEELEEMLR